MESSPARHEIRETESALDATDATVFAVLMMTDVGGRVIERDILRETTVIGSGRGCDIRLKSEDIAAAHCILSLESGTLRLRDLGSRAGTRVNGTRVRTTILTDGDELQLGRHRLRVETNLPGQMSGGFYLDQYHVTEILGSGGMCWIYGARDTYSRERVALKLLPSRHSARMLAHFGIEARASMRLNHPHVIRIFRIAQVDQLYYLVMEYLEAITLQEHVENLGKLAWKQACSIARQLALGLDHVHSRGIVHRDIKPANVLCQHRGQAKLIDFGLALLADDPEQERLSRLYQNQILGTADYISPEQSRLSSDVDARSDLYSLGCTLFYALTGRVPFSAIDVKEKIRAHRHQAPEDPRSLVPELPDDVAAIVLKLMAKNREERFESGAELAQALEPWAEDRAISFDWQATLSIRAAAAQRRLARLVTKKRPSAQNTAVAPVVLADSTTSTQAFSEALNRRGQALEASLMEYLCETEGDVQTQRNDWGELFQLWTFLSAAQRTQLLEHARNLQQAGESLRDPATL